jgi:hypothetical protein
MRSMRVREIAMLALYRHRGLPDTDDRDTYLELIARHLKPKDGDIPFALGNWARRLGANLPEGELLRIARAATNKPRRLKADTIGKLLNVTYAERCALKLTTIGCYDVPKPERAKRRKEKRRMTKQNRRRSTGTIPRHEYLTKAISRQKPWLAQGISRRTWYRRISATPPMPLTTTKQDHDGHTRH